MERTDSKSNPVVTFTMFWVAIGALAMTGLVRAWGITLVWHWHVEPLGVRPLSFWAAYGVVCLVSLFTQNHGTPWKSAEQKREQASESTLDRVVSALAGIVGLNAALLLGVGIAWFAWRMGQP